MNPIQYLNPIRQPNTSLFPNIGVGVNTRRLPVQSYTPQRPTDLRLNKLVEEKKNLENILKQKEKDQVETIKRIEMERQQREKEQLGNIKSDIEYLKQKLDEKNKLYNDIHNIFLAQKETNFNEALNHIEESRKMLTDDISQNEKEMLKIKEEELQYKLQLKEKEIIKQYEKEKYELEIKRREEEKKKTLQAKEEETLHQINAIKLKFLQKEQEELKTDIYCKETQEKLLQKQRPEKNSDSLNMHHTYQDDDLEDDMATSYLKKSFKMTPSKSPSQQINQVVNEIEEEQDDETNTKLGLMKKLMKDLNYGEMKLPPPIQSSSKNEADLKNQTQINSQKTQRKKTIIEKLPHLVGSHLRTQDSLQELLAEKEDTLNDYSDILGKINQVNTAFNTSQS